MYFSRLKPNLRNSEIAGNGVLKRIQVAVCGMCCRDVNIHTIKILGTHFSYNEKLNKEKNFYNIETDIQQVLKIWKRRKLTLKGKIMIFKAIVTSKIVFQSL